MRTRLTRPGRVSPTLVSSILANLALAAGVGWLLFGPKPQPSTQTATGSGAGTASSTANDPADALGRIQPAGGVIGVYGPPADRIAEFRVKVGDMVAKDQPLAVLSGETDRRMNLDVLDAQIAESEALKKSILASRDAKLADIDAEATQATVGVEQDTRAIDAKVKATDAQLARADKEEARMKAVQSEGVRVSDQEFEQVRAGRAVAEAERTAALAQKEKITVVRDQSSKSIDSKKATVRAETERALAAVPLSTLQANRKLAERKLKDGELRAPTAGRVVRILAKPGDTLATQPVLQLADTGKMNVLAEVYETDVGRVREWLAKGPVAVEVEARVLGGEKKLTGHVSGPSKVSTVISKNVLTPLGPREDADRRVVEVEVELDDAAAKQAENFIGLQVRAKFIPPK